MKKSILLILITLVFLGACNSPKHLAKPMEFRQYVKGLFFQAKLKQGAKVLGEIIEVNDKAIILLPLDETSSRIITISRELINKAEIVIASTSDNPKGISTWAGLNNITVLGHGGFGIFTLPINLATTIAIDADATTTTYRVKYPNQISWDEIAKFARFPQGIPQNISPNAIK